MFNKEIEMKRVIDGVEYEAVHTNNDHCVGCIGNEIGSLSLCQQLRKNCHYKIWKILEEHEETEQSSVNTNADKTNKTLKPHKHAEDMKLYAGDAATTDKPWKLWEFSHKEESHWYPLSNHPEWNLNYNYRRKAVKPKTININGYEVPEPYRGSIGIGSKYYVPDITNRYDTEVYAHSWDNFKYEEDLMKKGLVHLTQEAAQKHLDALLSFTRKE